MRWTDIEAEQPRLAEIGREKLLAAGVALLGTIRRDDTPRLSPGGTNPLGWRPVLRDGLALTQGWRSGARPQDPGPQHRHKTRRIGWGGRRRERSVRHEMAGDAGEVRRGTSAQSHAAPEPISDLLVR